MTANTQTWRFDRFGCSERALTPPSAGFMVQEENVSHLLPVSELEPEAFNRVWATFASCFLLLASSSTILYQVTNVWPPRV